MSRSWIEVRGKIAYCELCGKTIIDPKSHYYQIILCDECNKDRFTGATIPYLQGYNYVREETKKLQILRDLIEKYSPEENTEKVTAIIKV